MTTAYGILQSVLHLFLVQFLKIEDFLMHLNRDTVLMTVLNGYATVDAVIY